jgi:hypothetical protein
VRAIGASKCGFLRLAANPVVKAEYYIWMILESKQELHLTQANSVRC